ncbi:hypothetical protein WS68_04515 [Burkholderia sp. TSV86]|nr:hypothetical protein WS68_04515 [Burkholderia sp. TSV86]
MRTNERAGSTRRRALALGPVAGRMSAPCASRALAGCMTNSLYPVRQTWRFRVEAASPRREAWRPAQAGYRDEPARG